MFTISGRTIQFGDLIIDQENFDNYAIQDYFWYEYGATITSDGDTITYNGLIPPQYVDPIFFSHFNTAQRIAREKKSQQENFKKKQAHNNNQAHFNFARDKDSDWYAKTKYHSYLFVFNFLHFPLDLARGIVRRYPIASEIFYEDRFSRLSIDYYKLFIFMLNGPVILIESLFLFPFYCFKYILNLRNAVYAVGHLVSGVFYNIKMFISDFFNNKVDSGYLERYGQSFLNGNDYEDFRIDEELFAEETKRAIIASIKEQKYKTFRELIEAGDSTAAVAEIKDYFSTFDILPMQFTTEIGTMDMLAYAIYKNHVPVIEFLLESSQQEDNASFLENKIYSEAHGNHRPLVFAMLISKFKIAELLVHNGANVNISYQDDEYISATPLIKAAEQSQLRLAGALISHGASLSITCTKKVARHIIADLFELVIVESTPREVLERNLNFPPNFIDSYQNLPEYVRYLESWQRVNQPLLEISRAKIKKYLKRHLVCSRKLAEETYKHNGQEYPLTCMFSQELIRDPVILHTRRTDYSGTKPKTTHFRHMFEKKEITRYVAQNRKNPLNNMDCAVQDIEEIPNGKEIIKQKLREMSRLAFPT